MKENSDIAFETNELLYPEVFIKNYAGKNETKKRVHKKFTTNIENIRTELNQLKHEINKDMHSLKTIKKYHVHHIPQLTIEKSKVAEVNIYPRIMVKEVIDKEEYKTKRENERLKQLLDETKLVL